MALIDIVAEAYRNAIENGYEIDKWTDEDIAIDMCEYDADLEMFPTEEIEECLKQLRNAGLL